MKQLIICIYVVSIALLMGCAGNPPLVVNFMDSEYIRSVKVSAWTGDVVMEDADTVDGPYIGLAEKVVLPNIYNALRPF